MNDGTTTQADHDASERRRILDGFDVIQKHRRSGSKGTFPISFEKFRKLGSDAEKALRLADDEIRRYRDRLVIGPQGDDRIDELESATEHLRARLADAERSAAVRDEPEGPVPGPLERLTGLVEGLRREFGRDDPLWAPADTISGLVEQLEEELAQGGLVVRPDVGPRP